MPALIVMLIFASKWKRLIRFFLVHIKEDIEFLVQNPVDIVRIREKMNPFLRERIEKEGLYV